MARQAAGRRTRPIPVPTTGLSENVWVDSGNAREADGVYFQVTGECVSANGLRTLVDWDENPFDGEVIDAIAGFEIREGPTELVLSVGDSIVKVRGRGVAEIDSGRSVARCPAEGTSFAQHAGWLFITNGRDSNKKWNGDYLAPVGVSEAPAPPEASGISWDSSTAGSKPPGVVGRWSITGDVFLAHTWEYRATFINTAGQEGPASPRAVGLRPADESTLSSLTEDDFAAVKILLPSPATDDLAWTNIYKRAVVGGFYYWRTVPSNVRVVYDYDLPLADAANGEPLVPDRGQPPSARWVTFFRGRAYYAGIRGREAFLWYSNAGFPEECPLFNLFDVGSDDGEPITGLVSFADSIIVFKPTSMWQITALASGEPVLTKIDNGIGSIAPRAAITAYDTLLFVNDRGIYGFDGARSSPLTNSISKLWRNVSQDWLKNAVAWRDEENKRILFALPFGTGEELDTILVYHYTGNGFSAIEGRRVTAAGNYKGMPLLGARFGDGSSDVVIDGFGYSLEAVHNDSKLNVKRITSSGQMSSRVRYGPFDQTTAGWSYNESMEVVGIDLFLGYTTAATLTVRAYRDREKVPAVEVAFSMSEGGVAANQIENQDLSSLKGWGEKNWLQDTWTGDRQIRRRISFPEPVLCREIEIEFELVPIAPPPSGPRPLAGGDDDDRRRPRQRPMRELFHQEHLRIEGFELVFVTKGSERQR